MNQFAGNHIRLLTAVAVGVVVFFLLPVQSAPLVRVLVAWNCGVALFLMLIYLWMRSLSAEQICSRFVEEDESAPVILMVVTVAACLSVVAIVLLLSTNRQLPGAVRDLHFILAAVTVVESWLLVPTMFTLQYADLFYSAPAPQRPLEFPRTPMPVFWDFAYFSFTISAACQTPDVTTQDRNVRRMVLAHTIIAFFFNASILGLAINVSAGLISGN